MTHEAEAHPLPIRGAKMPSYTALLHLLDSFFIYHSAFTPQTLKVDVFACLGGLKFPLCPQTIYLLFKSLSQGPLLYLRPPFYSCICLQNLS